jgi:hypothetical protein
MHTERCTIDRMVDFVSIVSIRLTAKRGDNEAIKAIAYLRRHADF